MKKLEEKIKQNQNTQDKFFTIFTITITAFGIVWWYGIENEITEGVIIISVLLLFVNIVLLGVIVYLYYEISALIDRL